MKVFNRAVPLCLLIALLVTSPVRSAPNQSSPNQPTQPAFPGQRDGFTSVSNFHFTDGEVLKSLRLHFVTLGSPHRDRTGKIDNAVLLLHSTGDDASDFLGPDFSLLFGAGEALDLRRYYVIIPDSIGHGRSSKPSDGLRARFPHYGYEDMVTAQHQVVSELGVEHLRLVLGVSMGGMHTWLWGERYPTMMDALFPISALPVEIGGRNRLWRHALVEAIRNDPEWKGGNYVGQPHIFARMIPLLVIMTGNPQRQFELHPTKAAADAWYEKMYHGAYGRADANDALYHYDASSDYNPEPALGAITARLHLILFADDQINSPEFSVLARTMPRVKYGQYTIVPAGPKTGGEAADNTNALLWNDHLSELLRSKSE